ncbi:actin-like protein ALP4 [Cardiosporidium cionae]|uniref:Actin-like protein ALP4 n=1 Tax=Cardiosporidium cionae TaxID=476202 RepID=A0ABQ7JBE5_9APIC|nr:actin-like protein ALP4 [Cardiosporidium cionae]|eukprot:KAF8821331.1 actin-like protein ALP4 [Cardiosporidium cionae]
MEGFGTFEKPPIVIDFGENLTKIGVAGEHQPRFILPTFQILQMYSEGGYRRKSIGNAVTGSGSQQLLSQRILEDDWIPILHKGLRLIYFEYLLVDPNERKVILLESVTATKSFREAAAFVLFTHFQVPSISFLPSMVSPLYCCGIPTGIVVDLGYSESRIMPVYCGVAMYGQFECIPIGAKLLNKKLRLLLLEDQTTARELNIVRSLSEATLEDIKVRGCYVSFALENGSATVPATDQRYHTAEGTFLIAADSRWKLYECLFGLDETEDPLCSVPAAIARCLEKCPLDTRKELVQNIVLCGGMAEILGLLTRIAIELRMVLLAQPQLKTLERLAGFAVPSFLPLCRQWIGGSIYGMLKDTQEFSMDNFLESEGNIPDWTNWVETFIYQDQPKTDTVMLLSSD